jgi:quinol monooxygenase YgiN
MIFRIVQMTFREDAVADFISLFNSRKQQIRDFKGCTHLELLQDTSHPGIFFTYSIWDSQADLDHYRYSEFFKDTWGRTKALFADRPQAWSVTQRYVL